jgi:hypothetical protein
VFAKIVQAANMTKEFFLFYARGGGNCFAVGNPVPQCCLLGCPLEQKNALNQTFVLRNRFKIYIFAG